MKGLKKLALVTAVAAAPFAQAEMTAMDDALLGEMTGQAGITIDVDLDMTIDAIKYVDSDGNAGGSGVQGALTMKGLTIDNDGAAATIRGITIDADGTDGLVIGLNQIGDELGNGIDITVDAVLINDGSANLQSVNAVNAANTAGFNVLAGGYNYVDYATGAVTTEVGTAVSAAAAAGVAADDTAAQAAGFPDFATMVGAAASGNAAAQAEIVGNAGSSAAYGQAAGTLADAQAASAVGDVIAAAGGGNIGGFKIENFRNYIQDSLVGEYNGVFDMALQDSTGDLTGAGAAGRFVRGEIVINGTGTYNPAGSTGGLRISGQFGGAIDKAAWVDNNGGEFGIADLGFFHGVDNDGDTIADTIEGMHFTVDIDVVDRASSIAGNGLVGGPIAKGDTVAQLQISNMSIEGTIMMGQIYVGNEAGTQSTSLGSVLVKDIDMTGTTVWVYGH
ncbi:DUF6160 family protein [Bermanella sp. WJH001]|uniref:DUF6160 family protein n=1 Tax=Bermanella sp. WJH001 TaxID=3048005 RepID=UPI0024BE2492|nr:DUF6160 family protein [Bermanella sp. WJH001]MDJ1539853.1 DUF6160 family protein [Bermanella sp. WJH001]